MALYVAILAGGVGSRLWPKSRTSTPKQFLNLTGTETMIQTAVRRLLPMVPIENIFILTGERYVSLVQEQLPGLPVANIIAEPNGKNTAPAIGLGALHIASRDPNAVMAVLTADHIIPDENAFLEALRAAVDVAGFDKLVTLGVAPTGPETGYGYIHRGELLGTDGDLPVYRVSKFLEKPDIKTAKQFFTSGKYYWNSGMFVWKTQVLFDALAEHAKDLSVKLYELGKILHAGDNQAILDIWNTIEADSIDFALMEKTDNVAVVPLSAGWNDVGGWSALHQEITESPDENSVIQAAHLNVDSKGLLIQGNGRLVATIGVRDLVIVQTDDALLVCHRDRVQDVKKIVQHLKETGQQDYL